MSMERANAILKDGYFLHYLNKNELYEEEGTQCRHGITHALEVCRVGYILILEQGLPIAQELFYAAALLHDIGHWVQASTGIDHARAGADLAAEILECCDFTEAEAEQILTAIANHRSKHHPDDFSRILYQADKLSRNCVMCAEIGECKRFKNGIEPKLAY